MLSLVRSYCLDMERDQILEYLEDSRVLSGAHLVWMKSVDWVAIYQELCDEEAKSRYWDLITRMKSSLINPQDFDFDLLTAALESDCVDLLRDLYHHVPGNFFFRLANEAIAHTLSAEFYLQYFPGMLDEICCTANNYVLLRHAESLGFWIPEYLVFGTVDAEYIRQTLKKRNYLAMNFPPYLGSRFSCHDLRILLQDPHIRSIYDAKVDICVLQNFVTFGKYDNLLLVCDELKIRNPPCKLRGHEGLRISSPVESLPLGLAEILPRQTHDLGEICCLLILQDLVKDCRSKIQLFQELEAAIPGSITRLVANIESAQDPRIAKIIDYLDTEGETLWYLITQHGLCPGLCFWGPPSLHVCYRQEHSDWPKLLSLQQWLLWAECDLDSLVTQIKPKNWCRLILEAVVAFGEQSHYHKYLAPRMTPKLAHEIFVYALKHENEEILSQCHENAETLNVAEWREILLQHPVTKRRTVLQSDFEPPESVVLTWLCNPKLHSARYLHNLYETARKYPDLVYRNLFSILSETYSIPAKCLVMCLQEILTQSLEDILEAQDWSPNLHPTRIVKVLGELFFLPFLNTYHGAFTLVGGRDVSNWIRLDDNIQVNCYLPAAKVRRMKGELEAILMARRKPTKRALRD